MIDDLRASLHRFHGLRRHRRRSLRARQPFRRLRYLDDLQSTFAQSGQVLLLVLFAALAQCVETRIIELWRLRAGAERRALVEQRELRAGEKVAQVGREEDDLTVTPVHTLFSRHLLRDNRCALSLQCRTRKYC
ncbi:MAG: hypothetical protein ACT443_09760 [Gemmatimonadota bacterium]